MQENHTVTADAAHGVLANNTAPVPNDTLSVSTVDGQAANVGHALTGSYGTLTLKADGSYAYLATPELLPLPSGVGVDTFSYTAIDGAGGTATSTLTVVVTSPGQTYVGGTSGTTIQGGFGLYVLDGGAGNDTLVAGTGVQTLIADRTTRSRPASGSTLLCLRQTSARTRSPISTRCLMQSSFRSPNLPTLRRCMPSRSDPTRSSPMTLRTRSH